MILRSLTIRNFKAIGDTPATVEFKPITLLFGPNSAGKSTILQALLYLSEILERNNTDPGRTRLGGALDLGGFRNLVHGRDPATTVTLRADFEPNEPWVPNWRDEDLEVFSELSYSRDIDFIVQGGYGLDVDSAWIELDIRWSNIEARAFVSRYEVGINGSLIGVMESTPDLKRVEIVRMNWWHPLLVPHQQDGGAESWEPPLSFVGGYADEAFDEMREALSDLRDDPNPYETALSLFIRHHFSLGRVASDAPLPPLPVATDAQRGAMPLTDHPLDLPISPIDAKNNEIRLIDNANCRHAVRLISEAFIGPREQLRKILASLRYLGPLRDIPPRSYNYARYPDEARWATGLAAWDVLHHENPKAIEEINGWLSLEDRLAAGYKVEVKKYKELDLDSPLMIAVANEIPFEDEASLKLALEQIPTKSRVVLRDLSNDVEVAPQDIGVGVSQVFPLVVAAVLTQEGLVAIEQPELHIHPAFQVRLGDLFVARAVNPVTAPNTEQPRADEAELGAADAAQRGDEVADSEMEGRDFASDRPQFLIETHSEHLMLRFLRRIRETTDGELPPGAPALHPDDVAVHFVEPTEEGAKVTRLRIDENGDFIDRWPKGFFDERAKELF